MQLIRLNPNGIRFDLKGEDVNTVVETVISTTKKSMVFQEPIERLNQSWYDWQMRGKLIQDAFPYLNNEEREFLITGLLPAEWDALFNEDL